MQLPLVVWASIHLLSSRSDRDPKLGRGSKGDSSCGSPVWVKLSAGVGVEVMIIGGILFKSSFCGLSMVPSQDRWVWSQSSRDGACHLRMLGEGHDG